MCDHSKAIRRLPTLLYPLLNEDRPPRHRQGSRGSTHSSAPSQQRAIWNRIVTKARLKFPVRGELARHLVSSFTIRSRLLPELLGQAMQFAHSFHEVASTVTRLVAVEANGCNQLRSLSVLPCVCKIYRNECCHLIAYSLVNQHSLGIHSKARQCSENQKRTRSNLVKRIDAILTQGFRHHPSL